MSDIWFKKMPAVVIWMTFSTDFLIRRCAGRYRHVQGNGGITSTIFNIYSRK